MDALQYIRLILALARLLAGPVLAQITPFESRSSAIGFIFMLLIVASITETVLIGLFRLIRIISIVALACLFSAASIELLAA
jgi:hypothetical protein